MTTDTPERIGITTKVTIGGMRGYITANPTEDGDCFEVFVHGFGQWGSVTHGWTDVACILMSIGFQNGLDLEKYAHRLCQLKFEPFGETDHPEIPHCHSVPDFLCRWLAKNFGSKELQDQLDAVYKSVLPKKKAS